MGAQPVSTWGSLCNQRSHHDFFFVRIFRKLNMVFRCETCYTVGIVENSSDHPLLIPFLDSYEELIRFLTRKLGCRDLAAEIVQETYLHLVRVGVSVEITHPRAFLFRMAANLATDHQRKSQCRARYCHDEELPVETADPRPSAETTVLGKQQVGLLMQAIGELPPKCRAIFILHKFKHLSYAEIAVRLGISRSTVVKHMVKALDYCKRRVEGDS